MEKKYGRITADLILRLSNKQREMFEQILCEHRFIEHGLGYACVKCELYTGTNTEWNNIILRQLLKDDREDEKKEKS